MIILMTEGYKFTCDGLTAGKAYNAESAIYIILKNVNPFIFSPTKPHNIITQYQQKSVTFAKIPILILTKYLCLKILESILKQPNYA